MGASIPKEGSIEEMHEMDRDALDKGALSRLEQVLWEAGPEVWGEFQDAIAAFVVAHGTDRCEYYLDSATTLGIYSKSMGFDDNATADVQRLYRFLGSLTPPSSGTEL
jgi:hypothetical protein